jgi:hypothetical protein
VLLLSAVVLWVVVFSVVMLWRWCAHVIVDDERLFATVTRKGRKSKHSFEKSLDNEQAFVIL